MSHLPHIKQEQILQIVEKIKEVAAAEELIYRLESSLETCSFLYTIQFQYLNFHEADLSIHQFDVQEQ